MNKKISYFLLIIFFSIFANLSHAKDSIETKEDGIYVSKISSAEIDKFFEILNYTDYKYREDWKYPPVFLKTMPYDFDKIEDEDIQKNLFIRILTPIAMKINEDISLENLDILIIKEKLNQKEELSKQDIDLLEENAKKYDVFTRLEGDDRHIYIANHLIDKIEIVPVSILVAIAAIETNWGNSKYLMEGNSLYKEKNWFSEQGMKPTEDKEDNTYRIKTYESLYDSMYDYALKMNSTINFDAFRFTRKEELSRHNYLDGRFAANNFHLHSPLENFAGILDYTITFYHLTNLDRAELSY